jgi:hypothetical protein
MCFNQSLLGAVAVAATPQSLAGIRNPAWKVGGWGMAGQKRDARQMYVGKASEAGVVYCSS